MIYLFVPYYGVWPEAFTECLNRQSVKHMLIPYNRKENGGGWTSACNQFYKSFCKWRGTEDDVVCIMNNDITFDDNFLSEGCRVKPWTVLIPKGEGITIDWRTKQCHHGADTFPGRAFFMCADDFIRSGGFCRWLPHYLADYDFGFKLTRKGVIVSEMSQGINHEPHSVNRNPWRLRSVNNPLSWTLFLLRNGLNKYIFLNLLKSWSELFIKHKA
jgi:hypothetical protein